MEFITYLLILCAAILFSYNQSLIKSEVIFRIFFLCVYTFLSLVVRTEYDIDIKTYASSMSVDSMSFYYIKEPIIWFGTRLLFDFTSSTYLVFLIVDLICGILIYKTFNNFRLPQYSYLAFLVFFPFVLGMQNVYRQWVATLIFMYVMSKSDKDLLSNGALYLLSILTHNVAGLFALVFAYQKRIPLKRIAILTLIGAMPAIIYLGSATKSSASTGLDLSVIFLAVLLLIGALFIITGRLVIREFEYSTYGLIALSSYIVFCSVIILSSASAERVAMFALMIIYPKVVLRIEETLFQKVFFRSTLAIFGFIPLLLFGTREFIL